jgi:hypothetical protein
MKAVHTSRRVVLGLSGREEVEQPLELAVGFARGMGAMLNCLLFEREDLMTASRLPFTRITGHGGISAPMTPEYVIAHLRRLARAVEENLIARCAEAGIDWKLERPHGDYVAELLSAIEEGDVVILERVEAELPARHLADVVAAVLGKGAAVVLPGTHPKRAKAILVIARGEDDEAAAIAERTARSLGVIWRRISPAQLHSGNGGRAIVIIETGMLQELGGLDAVRRHIGRSSTLVLMK